jgi:hypothetical protein
MILAVSLTPRRFEAPAIPRSLDSVSQHISTPSVREPEDIPLPSGEVRTPENPPPPRSSEQPSTSPTPATAAPPVSAHSAPELKRKRDAITDIDAESATPAPEKRSKITYSARPAELAGDAPAAFDLPHTVVELDPPTGVVPRDVFEPASQRTEFSFDFDDAEDYNEEGDVVEDANYLVFQARLVSSAGEVVTAPLPDPDVLTYQSPSASSPPPGAKCAPQAHLPALVSTTVVSPAHTYAPPLDVQPPLPPSGTAPMPPAREDTDPQALPPLLRLGSHVIGGTFPSEKDMKFSSPITMSADGTSDLLARIEMSEGPDYELGQLDQAGIVSMLAHSCPSAVQAVHVAPIDVGNHTTVSKEDATEDCDGVLAAESGMQQLPLDLTLDISTSPTTPIASGIPISHELSLAPREPTITCLPTPLSSRATSLARTMRAASTPGNSASAACTPHKFIDLASKERQSPRPERRARELHELLSQKAREWERKWDERERSLDERARAWDEQCATQAQLVADLSQAWDDRELLWEARLREQERRYEEERQCWEARVAEVERRQEEDRSLHEEAEQTLASRLGGIEEQLERVRTVAAAAGRMLQDT